VKRTDLIKKLTRMGCELVRHGGKHDWYRNSSTGNSQPVPRHREIKESLARHIIKQLSDPRPQARDDPSNSR
jgi:predicted RNA binding protein YcfA (HicA-like mRNA interferase family)